jgi:nucleotidyltransferase/DNA polymerase involved in DNA repair
MPTDGPRFVALVDLDAFYASVELREDPTLAGKPVLIGGSPTGRGVVAAASYEARKYGCHSAMPMARAVRLCPNAVILRPRFSLYHEYSQQVMDILRRETDLVEQVSVDEAYVDLTPVAKTMHEAEGLAHRMQGRVRLDLGLPCSVGLAPNKMIAKMACEAGKPQGFVVVRHGEEAAFLAPRDVDDMPGIGPRTAQRLRAAGFDTLGQIAQAPLQQIMTVLGPYGAVIQRRALGDDPSPVVVEHDTKSVSAEETFEQDVSDPIALAEELARLAQRVAGSLEHHGLLARTVTLKVRNADFHTITRSASRSRATADAETIFAEAKRLLDANWRDGEPVRLIGVGVSNLRPVRAPGQLAFDL